MVVGSKNLSNNCKPVPAYGKTSNDGEIEGALHWAVRKAARLRSR